MEEEGFALPEPRRGLSGHHDAEEWEFDLTGTEIDTSTDRWNRALFVTCGIRGEVNGT